MVGGERGNVEARNPPPDGSVKLPCGERWFTHIQASYWLRPVVAKTQDTLAYHTDTLAQPTDTLAHRDTLARLTPRVTCPEGTNVYRFRRRSPTLRPSTLGRGTLDC